MKQLKILFLDDDLERHKQVRSLMTYDAAYTVKDATDLLQKNEYDLVFLDHDLGGLQMVESEGPEETGYTVAKWMAEHKPVVEDVVLHSLNPGGAANQLGVLRGHYTVTRMPFTRFFGTGQWLSQFLKKLTEELNDPT